MELPKEFMPIGEVLEGGMEGTTVAVRGWLYRNRSSGKLAFSVVRDATGVIQATSKKGVVPDAEFDAIAKALIESSVVVEGEVKADPRAPGGYEIQARRVKVLSFAEDFPIKEQQSPELLLDNRHLWIRSQNLTKVFKVKHHLLTGLRTWFDENGFWEVTPSVITTNAAEGGSSVFKFDYFGQEAYLSQTAQMYLEAAIFSLEKVYSLTPSFRAEKSRTTRHLTEYGHLEGEMAWMDWRDNMKVQEGLIVAGVAHVLEKSRKDLRDLGANLEMLEKVRPPFPVISYTEAVERLKKKGHDLPWGEDLGTNEERLLTEDAERPLFVEKFPRAIKAFYMKVNPEDPKTVLCNDCLAPGGFGEIVGASQREESNDAIIERLKHEGANLQNYAWYLDLRKYGSVPHSGFGLGVERLLRWITNQEHIRDMTLFPRTINRAYP